MISSDITFIRSLIVFCALLILFDTCIVVACSPTNFRRNNQKEELNHRIAFIVHHQSNESLTKNESHSGRLDLNYDDIYSEWSPWSKCRKRCKQIRTRVCKSPEHCRATILKEERSCTGDKCQMTVSPLQNDQNYTLETNQKGHGRSPQFKVLYHLQNFVYSQWSEWSPCTKLCRTRRYRACEMEPVCGNSIIHEDALCYSQGSPCEKLYKRRRKNKVNSDSEINDTDFESYQNEQKVSHINDNNCGVSSVKHDIVTNLRIIGGRESTKGRWPWMVAILNRHHEPFCGGTIITPQFILTAAHCVRRRLYIRGGEHDLIFQEGSEQQIRVSDIFIHPDYDAETVDNDIALLRLRFPLRFNKHISSVCLPSPDDVMPINSLGTILGWGKRRNSAVFGTDVLHQAQVPIADTDDCKKIYDNYFISTNMVCAGYKRGKVDSCAGDSGGPLMNYRDGKWHIYGITSFGEGCGRRGRYGIYAKVPNFVRWIRKTIERNTKI